MEPPSARPWLGVGAALSALPAAGGCFCAALVLAVVADSDPGGVYEQHRWLGAIVAAGAVCAYVAMMGWATLRHGGLPAPVLLIALVLAGVPFLFHGSLFIPAAVVAVAGSAALATAGLAHPPASPDRVRSLCGGLAVTALVLAVGQAAAVSVLHGTDPPRAELLASHSAAKPAARAKPKPTHSRTKHPAPHEPVVAPFKSKPAPAPAKRAPTEPVPAGSAPVELAPDGAAPAAAERFVREYYAALDGRRFRVAWRMLAPGV